VKEQELLSRVAQKNILAAALQEMWLTKDKVDKDVESGCVILNHGPESKPCRRGALGVAIVLSPIAARAWEKGGSKVDYYGERIVAVRLQMEDSTGYPLTLFIASAYAPDSARPQTEKDKYAEDLQICIDACGGDAIPIFCMDCNASIGIRSEHDVNEPGQDRVRGMFGVKHTNIAGQELHALLAVNELSAATTFFKKREYATWYHPTSKKGHQIDHIIVRQQDMKRVRDAGFIGWRGVDSDHRAVYVRMNLARYLKLKRRPVGPKPSRIDRGMLN
jgi:exonuclease III